MPVQNLPFQTLVTIDRTLDIPVFKQLADELIRIIRLGYLRPAMRLPSSRELAKEMKLNRTTVVAAYDELSIQGWVNMLPRKGVVVASVLPIATPRLLVELPLEENITMSAPAFFKRITEDSRKPDTPIQGYDLVVNDGYPDSRIAPLQVLMDRYKYLQGRVLKLNSIISEAPAGAESLRTALSSYLSQTRGLNIGPDNILLTRGAQGAIYIAASMIVKPGSKVLVSKLSYSMANKVFKHLGAQLILVNVDEDGMDVDMIERICGTEAPDLLYIVPHHHHPTTVTLSADRRTKLLRIVQQYRLPVIEDDYDYDFHYDNAPILPLASADHSGLILYIGSLSKTLSLGVRSGFLVAGEEFVWQAGKLKELMELRGDYLMEDAIAYLFKTGEMSRHISRSVKLYKERRDRFCSLLSSKLQDGIHFNVPLGGMAVWALFNPEYSLPGISSELARRRIYLSDGSNYHQENPSLNGVRLGFASLNETEMLHFVEEVRAIMRL